MTWLDVASEGRMARWFSSVAALEVREAEQGGGASVARDITQLSLHLQDKLVDLGIELRRGETHGRAGAERLLEIAGAYRHQQAGVESRRELVADDIRDGELIVEPALENRIAGGIVLPPGAERASLQAVVRLVRERLRNLGAQEMALQPPGVEPVGVVLPDSFDPVAAEDASRKPEEQLRGWAAVRDAALRVPPVSAERGDAEEGRRRELEPSKQVR